MSDKTNTQNTETPQAVAAIPKFCPRDGSILYREYVPDFECDCWLCPEPGCGYTEPIL